MKRLSLLLLLLIPAVLSAQVSPIFPSRAVTNADMFIRADNCAPRLAQQIGSTDLTFAVTSATGCPTTNFLVQIESELVAVSSVSGSTFTVQTLGRGYSGTTATGHRQGLQISALNYAYLDNRKTAEIEALETFVLAGGGGGGGGGSFSAITSGTNSTAAMVCTSGCSINFSSLGSINASTVLGLSPFNASNITLGTLSNARLVSGGAITINTTAPLTGSASPVLGGTITLGVSAATSSTLGVENVSGTANQISVSYAAGTATLSFPGGGVTLPGTTTGTFSGAVTGNVVGNVTGNVTGNLTGNVTGNVTGSAGSFTGNLTGDTTSVGMATTTVKVNGVSYDASPSTNGIPVITAANTATYEVLGDCQDTAGNHINFNATTHVFSCGNTGGTAGSVFFSGVGSGTNANALLVSGTLAPTGGGTINANQINGLAAAASATTDTTNAANITSGILPNARLASVPNAALANSSVTIAGTTNQVTVTGGGPLSLGGTATLSLPQNIHTAATPRFASLGLGCAAGAVNTLTICGSSSGTATIATPSAAGTPTLLLPTVGGSLVGTGDTGTVTNAMLAGSITFAKLVGTDITKVSTITQGVWQGTPIANAFLANSTVNYPVGAGLTGGGSISLGGTATAISVANLGITNAMLAGSISFTKMTFPGGTTAFLRSDGTFAAPAGSGTVTVVGAGVLASTAIMTGGGLQTAQTPNSTSTLDGAGNMILGGNLTANGNISSGTAGVAGCVHVVDASGNDQMFCAKSTFASAATCNSASAGSVQMITDANTNTWGAVIAGGGSNKVQANCNGTAWTVMGK